MKRLSILSIVIVFPLAISVLFSSCQKEDELSQISSSEELSEDQFTNCVDGGAIEGQYIVQLNEGTLPSALKVGVGQSNIELIKSYSELVLNDNNIAEPLIDQIYGNSIQGFSARLNDSEVSQLLKDNRIKSIEQDRRFKLTLPEVSSKLISSQILPIGVKRVGFGNGLGKTAWIIDSGIDLDNADLNVDKARSKSFLSGSIFNLSANDFYGHGTHVAGILAAKNNGIGVLGVASGAKVVSVRVLDDQGWGSLSGVISGIDYVAQNAVAGEVANLSLGGNRSDILDAAVKKASDKGIWFVLSAGNDATHANFVSPARVNGPFILTVSAVSSKDVLASFSNFGNPPVDFAAPGIGIQSLWLGGALKSLNGTSMACPHVAGIVLLRNGLPKTDGFVVKDKDSNPDPIAHL